ncbi:MAG: hypothetical protein Q8867_05580 [Bacteroidota bacterium]|nr:hypothetical protein [Bacteroidota bacterium]
MPWFLTGFLLTSLSGSFLGRNFFWVIQSWIDVIHTEKFKYSGTFFYLLKDRYTNIGLPVIVLFLSGIMACINPLFSKNRQDRSNALDFFILVFVPFILVFILMSFMTFKGMIEPETNTGFLSALLPLAGWISFKGFSLILRYFCNTSSLQKGFLGITSVIIIGCGMAELNWSSPTTEEKIIDQTIKWLHSENIPGSDVYYTNPGYLFHFGQNPFKRSGNTRIFNYRDMKKIPEGTVFIWDCHYGSDDCRIPMDSLVSSGKFRLVQCFSSINKYDSLNADFYESFIFRKQSCKISENMSFLKKAGKLPYQTKVLADFDFEKTCSQVNSINLTNNFVYQGKYSYEMFGYSQYSPGLVAKVSDVSDSLNDVIIRVSLNIFPIIDFRLNTAYFVLSLDSGGDLYFFQTYLLEKYNLRLWHWNFINVQFYMTGIHSFNDILRCYIQHSPNQSIYMDNMRIERIRLSK